MLNRYRRELLLGALLSLAGLVWVTGEYLAGLHTTRIQMHPAVTNFFAVIPIALIVVALRARRRDDGGLTWRAGLTSGLVLSLANSALSPLTLYTFTRWINPGFFQAMIDFAVSSGQATRAQAEGYFNLGSYIGQSMVFSVVAGLVTSLIATAVLRRGGPKAPAGESPVGAASVVG